MSTIAVLGVLAGGTAYAAKLVTGAQIKDGTITSADVGNGKITGTDLAANTVTGNDIKNGGIGGLDIAADAIGNGQIQDGSISTSDIANNSIGIGDLSGATVNALTLASIDGTDCRRNDQDGTIRLEYSKTGYSMLFCEIPVTAESSEPNDTLAQAAPLTANGNPGLVGSISSASDVDWYHLTAPCQGTPDLTFGALGTGTDNQSFDANHLSRHVSATVYSGGVVVATTDMSNEINNGFELNYDLGVCTGASVDVKVEPIGTPVMDTYRIQVYD